MVDSLFRMATAGYTVDDWERLAAYMEWLPPRVVLMIAVIDATRPVLAEYIGLIESGDCGGVWRTPRDEPTIKALITALAAYDAAMADRPDILKADG